MLKWLKCQPAQPQVGIRDTLFGDVPFPDWIRVPAETMASEPWASFGRAKQLIDSADPRNATAVLEKVLEMPQLESRHYLQAYHFLRELGVNASPGKAKDVLGVVVEIAMEKGLDLVAGYADHNARYYNYSGAVLGILLLGLKQLVGYGHGSSVNPIQAELPNFELDSQIQNFPLHSSVMKFITQVLCRVRT